jgi:hypothetical protein
MNNYLCIYYCININNSECTNFELEATDLEFEATDLELEAHELELDNEFELNELRL